MTQQVESGYDVCGGAVFYAGVAVVVSEHGEFAVFTVDFIQSANVFQGFAVDIAVKEVAGAEQQLRLGLFEQLESFVQYDVLKAHFEMQVAEHGYAVAMQLRRQILDIDLQFFQAQAFDLEQSPERGEQHESDSGPDPMFEADA